MNHPPPQNPGQGGFRSMLPPAPFPNPHFPFPPGLNLFPPPPPSAPAQRQNAGAQTQPAKRKGKKQRTKKGKNGQNGANAQKQQQQQQQQQQQCNAAPPGAPSQPAYAAQQMALAQNGLHGVHDIYGQQMPHAQLPPHEQQQLLGHLQALIHSHHQPPQAPAGPAAAQPLAAGPNGKGPATQIQPPTGPKAKSKKASPGSKRDTPRQAPSTASGGVPAPTQPYLTTAALPPFPSPQPRPLLVIIDLNGTLIHRPSRRSNPTSFHPRPHASPFLHYVITTFTTMIWSSAKPENVRSVTDRLLTPSDRAGLVALWGREAFGFTEKDYNGRTQCYKRLERAWGDVAVRDSHPMGGVWDQSNTVLIDDSAEKARSEPFNLVEIPEFCGGEEAADVLPQVHTYLNTLALQGDVSRYIRENPFRLQDRFEMS